MKQTWEGRDANWLRYVMIGIEVLFAVVALGLVIRTYHGFSGGSLAVPRILATILGLMFAALTVGVIVAVHRFAPVTLTVDDEGIRLQHGSDDDFIAYADIAAVTELPSTVTSSNGVQIYPSAQFLKRTGSHDNPERPGHRWAISGQSFSDKQLEELIPIMRRHVQQADVTWYVSR